MENSRAARRNVIASMFIYGTIGVFVRYIPLPSSMTAMMRGLIGAPFLLLVLLSRRSRMDWGGIRRNLGLLCLSGAMLGINWILLFEAYRYTTVATATLCRGVLLALGAAVFYACIVIANKKLLGISAYDRVIMQLFISVLVLLPYNVLTGAFAALRFSPFILLMLLIVGAVHTGLAYLLYFGSMDALSSQTLAILSYIDPVVAVLLSALLLKEPLGAAGILGAALILGGAFISELPERKKKT